MDPEYHDKYHSESDAAEARNRELFIKYKVS